MPPSEPRGRVVLPPLGREAAERVLAPPWLPADAACRVPEARRAAAAAIPVLLAVPAAGGRLRLARALAALAAHPRPLVAATGRRPPLDGLQPGAALYLDATALAPESLVALEALLDDGAVWVLAGAEPGAALPASLAPRLAPVVLGVSALGTRPSDVPALARAILATLAARAGTAAPEMTPAAVACLAGYAWPGDVAELEAVLARALVASDGGAVDVAHVAHLGALGGGTALPGPAPPAPPPAGGAELEFLLAELAHELRNPMVTIKTYAEHLPALLEDPELRARFAALTGEAIARIDALLDNLLAFARLGPPRPEPVELAALLERVLAEAGPDLAGRAVRVRHGAGPAGHCTVDPEHVAYALRNLLTGVAREVPACEELVADASLNGVVVLRFAAAGAALERLRRLAAPDEAPAAGAMLTDPTLLPLSFRLARAVLARSGGDLSVVADRDSAATLVVRLPMEVEGRG